MHRYIARTALFIVCTALVASLSACAADGDVFSETKLVNWDDTQGKCFLDGNPVVFTNSAASQFQACEDLANSSLDGTLVTDDSAAPTLPDDIHGESYKVIICFEFCDCTPSGCTCTGPVCTDIPAY